MLGTLPLFDTRGNHRVLCAVVGTVGSPLPQVDRCVGRRVESTCPAAGYPGVQGLIRNTPGHRGHQVGEGTGDGIQGQITGVGCLFCKV